MTERWNADTSPGITLAQALDAIREHPGGGRTVLAMSDAERDRIRDGHAAVYGAGEQPTTHGLNCACVACGMG